MICQRPYHNQRGVTLVELIIAMIVISVALGGILLVMNYTTARSADPVLQHQAIAIAEAYLEEITLKIYTDPDADGEASRALFDDVDDYNNLPDTLVRDQTGIAIGALSGFAVSVVVTSPGFGTPAVAGFKIDVTVTDPAGETLTLTGYRADY